MSNLKTMGTPDCSADLSPIEKRIRDISEWLDRNGGSFKTEQRHLDEGSQERIYWHYGYLIALKDALRLLTGEKSTSQKPSKRDKTSPRHVA